MNTEAQRIAIAEACGYRMVEYPYAYPSIEMIKSRVSPEVFSQLLTYGYEKIPDYLNDLNAMAAAEQFAIFEDGAGSIIASEEYGRQLIRIVLEVDDEGVPATLSGVATVARSTAAQRAEAFLRTLNLWKE